MIKARAAKRRELLAATTTELETVQRMVTNDRLKDPDKIGVRVGRVINKYKMAKHLMLEISATQFAFHINEESVAAEAALDGLYVIRTARPAAQISSTETVRHYKGGSICVSGWWRKGTVYDHSRLPRRSACVCQNSVLRDARLPVSGEDGGQRAHQPGIHIEPQGIEPCRGSVSLLEKR